MLIPLTLYLIDHMAWDSEPPRKVCDLDVSYHELKSIDRYQVTIIQANT